MCSPQWSCDLGFYSLCDKRAFLCVCRVHVSCFILWSHVAAAFSSSHIFILATTQSSVMDVAVQNSQTAWLTDFSSFVWISDTGIPRFYTTTSFSFWRQLHVVFQNRHPNLYTLLHTCKQCPCDPRWAIFLLIIRKKQSKGMR